MSFMMMKKKKYRFQVEFLLESLTSVPFVNGILFAKIRLKDRKFSDTSQRVELENHSVKWGNRFYFTFKTVANLCTGVLEPCPCRISIRKEMKGGRSYVKVGYVDVDLCQFAGAGLTTRRYLLEGYDAKHRQDNSILCVTLAVNLLSGDPCFKVPTCNQPTLLPEETKSAEPDYVSTGSLASRSSGFGSLPRHALIPAAPTGVEEGGVAPAVEEPECPAPPRPTLDFELSHSRNSSYASGYGSLHSRQSSSESGHLSKNLTSGTAGYLELGGSLKERKRPLTKKQVPEENRVDSTRVNVGQLIDELFEASNLDAVAAAAASEESGTSSNLCLIINKDGTAALAATHTQHQP